MTVTTRPACISRAETWAQSLWDAAERHWSGRTGQDKNYRSQVVHPVIAEIIGDLVEKPSRNILDLGCGDGVLIGDRRCRELIGHDGQYLGVDINPSLLGVADDPHKSGAFSFLRMNLTDVTLPTVIGRNNVSWDVVVSVFVVQEIADIEAFFVNLADILYPHAYAIIVTVHPHFAEWLKMHERILIDDTICSNNETLWRWAGQYPIVDEHQGTFYLPHFQRTVDDYRALAQTAGLKVTQAVDIPDTPAHITAFCEEGFAPFREYPENLYWPAIGEMPSSVAMVIKSEDVSA